MTLPDGVLDRLSALLGPSGLLTEAGDVAGYVVEERGLYKGACAAVARPKSTDEVAAVVRVCAEAGQPIVPQGGNTGLVGGGVPFEHGGELVLSLRRMNRIRAVDPLDFTLVAEAGCTLEQVQQAAAEAGCLFPLSMGSEGSCTIGGNLATNAGGVQVLRFGNARELTLGLEVVLADGSVLHGLSALRKDNTGYDLRHLVLGSEGTLGIITAASLKLFPAFRDQATALVAVPDVPAALGLLSLARRASGDAVTAFELVARLGLELGIKHIPGVADPFDAPHPWYVLVELSSSRAGGGLAETLEGFLAEALEQGLALDAVVAGSLEQRKGLWRIREGVPPAQKHEGGSIKHDVSVPVSRVPDFIDRASAAVRAVMPEVRVCAFGHVGDGNIHFNLSQPAAMDKQAFLDRWEDFNRVVHDIIHALGGSISAEHGIGRLKCGELARYAQPEELELMRRIKQCFDPKNIFNPGKIL